MTLVPCDVCGEPAAAIWCGDTRCVHHLTEDMKRVVKEAGYEGRLSNSTAPDAGQLGDHLEVSGVPV